MLGPITWHVEREGPCVEAQLGLVLPSLHTNWREFLGSVRELAPNSVVVRRATTPSCGELCHVHRRNLNGNATEAVVSLNSMLVHVSWRSEHRKILWFGSPLSANVWSC